MSHRLNILAIESSGSPLSIAVLKSDSTQPQQFFLKSSNETTRSSEVIVPMISEVLQEALLEPKDLHAIAISQGPGSFTSLRVGMSVAKGLSLALEVPIIALPTLTLFYRYSLSLSPLQEKTIAYRLAIQHLKSEEFYYALFQEGAFKDAIDTGYATASEIIALVKAVQNEKQTKCDLVVKESNLAQRFFSDLDPLLLTGLTAESMLEWASEKYLAKEFADTETLIPLYIKEFEARKSNKSVFSKKM
ncbi:MAG: tRNA (adenosine(37)-N6)-threonylcarbamoyltransferase complex dimerization subunit type 1 TsaB [Chloroherpetonaceae bacterium]|nr:tRNA (adenosine(37)-N6)-threonylcarbamoyltransferase complex dimerization subunit type 1 TsaB [Chloroherpetonaceae bacterium]